MQYLLRQCLFLGSILFWICASASVVAEEAPQDTNEDLDRLIATLKDDAARQELIDSLTRLQAVQASEDESDAVNQFVGYLQAKQALLDELVLNVIESGHRIPEFFEWLAAELSNPLRRSVWSDVALRLTLVFVSGALIGWVLGRIWPEPDGELRTGRAVRTFLRHFLILAAYGLVAFGMLYWLDQPLLTRLVGVDLLLAWILSRLWRHVLNDLATPLMSDKDGRESWKTFFELILRGGTLAIAGYFILRAALRLGLPWSFHGFALHIVFLGTVAMFAIAIFRVRDPVADWIRNFRKEDPTFISRFLPLGLAAQCWHWLVTVLLLAHYLTWALALEGGFYYLIRATVLSVILLAAARIVSLYNDKFFASGVPILPQDDELMPDVQERANRYANPVRLIFRWIIVITVVLGLSWVWDTGLIEWLNSSKGQSVSATLIRLALLIALAVILTEAISIGVSRFVSQTTPDGQKTMSNRAITLAAIIKNVAIVLVIAVAIMLGLSELGVDAAALFAGAGVIGLAIGFGSQRLVQDLINGLFILLGDTVRVGDVVDVGKAGVVESLSMRTITLRSYDGAVHTVPYSTIDTVTNLTKDYSFAVFDIGISYNSDLQLAFAELQNIDREIRREWPFRRQILAPLEIAGVDALADSAVMIKARSKTRAGDQWAVRREMTKRIKQRFDQVGIEIPFPHRTLLITQSKKDASEALPDADKSTTIAPT